MSGFGAGFRKAREARGISIDGVANETRIAVKFLRAIESEEFDVLPGGIFNRGFIRTYAERLGLDPDQAVENYQRLVRDQESPEPEQPVERPARKTAPNWVLIAGIAALVIFAVAYALLSRNDAPANTPAPTTESHTEVPTPVVPPPPPPPEPPPAEKTAEPLPEPNPVESAAAKAPLTVGVRVTETSWVQVFIDGAPTDAAEFPPGTTRTYNAQKSIKMVVGNAGGLSLKVNDRDINPLGRPGEVRQFTLTPENAATLNSSAVPAN